MEVIGMKPGKPFWLFCLLALLVSGLVLGIGCSKTSTEVKEDEQEDPESDDDDDQVDDDDGAGGDSEAPQPPTVDDPRSPTSLEYQTITGIAEPGAYVRIAGGAEDEAVYAGADTGEFCAVIDLVLNTVNILSVTATDQAGNESDPTNISIEQVRNNVCLTGTATASSVSHSEPDRVPDQAIDGLYTSYWSNTSQPWYTEALRSPQWFRVQFSQLETINRMDLYWEENSYATKFEIHVSDSQEQPTPPHENKNWRDDYTLVAIQTNPDVGFNGHNHFDLSDSPVEARWIVVALLESVDVNVLLYKYKLQELEAYSLQSGETDPGCP
jgi:hypothetical protein